MTFQLHIFGSDALLIDPIVVIDFHVERKREREREDIHPAVGNALVVLLLLLLLLEVVVIFLFIDAYRRGAECQMSFPQQQQQAARPPSSAVLDRFPLSCFRAPTTQMTDRAFCIRCIQAGGPVYIIHVRLVCRHCMDSMCYFY